MLRYVIVLHVIIGTSALLHAMDCEKAIAELLAEYPAPAKKPSLLATIFCCIDKQKVVHEFVAQEAESRGDFLKVEVVKHVFEHFFCENLESQAQRKDTIQNEHIRSALQAGRADLLGLLLAHGPNPNFSSSSYYARYHELPLDLLVRSVPEAIDGSGYIHCAKLLITHGAQVVVQPKSWPTFDNSSVMLRPSFLYGPPLQRAVGWHKKSNQHMVKFLIDNGANVLDQEGYALANKLVLRSGALGVEVLLSCGADINQGHSVLPLMYENDLRDKVLWWLTLGAAIDGKDEHGKTVLHKAIRKGDVESLRMFLHNASFTKTKSQRRASQKYIVTVLCLLKKFGVCRDMRIMLLTYLPEELISLEHARLLMQRGVTLEALAPYCQKEWLQALFQTVDDQCKKECLKKVRAALGAYRLIQLRKLLESAWLKDLYQDIQPAMKSFVYRNNSFAPLVKVKNKRVCQPKRSVCPDVIAVLNPNNVAQHQDAIAQNVLRITF